jgi:tryptophan-specific transport protein
LVYAVWQAVTLGQIPREEFTRIIAKGGNIGHMVAAISNHQKTGIVMGLLNTFANLAVISSFLGGSLGLFNFIADKFGFADDYPGRLKSAALTFLPPTIASMFFPNGFIVAIGYAGLAATIFVIIIPATAARASRKNLGNPLFRVWGGNSLIYLMYAYGVLIAACHLLASFGSLPVYGH